MCTRKLRKSDDGLVMYNINILLFHARTVMRDLGSIVLTCLKKKRKHFAHFVGSWFDTLMMLSVMLEGVFVGHKDEWYML